MKLQNAKIVGFFSIPSPSLAEFNPTAYNNAMREAPKGSGTCAHCGMGIRHHVVVEDENKKRYFIGTTCAEKVGCDKTQIRYRMTDEEKEAKERQRAERQAKWDAQREAAEEAERIRIAKRLENVGWICDMLKSNNNDFHNSLAEQLEYHALSPRQAYYVAKASSETGRRNKKNGKVWDDIIDLCTATDEELESWNE